MSPPEPAIAIEGSMRSSAAVPAARGAGVDAARSALRDISMLVRPRIAVMELVTVVAAMGLTVAGDAAAATPRIGLPMVVVLLFGTALIAASSSIANQILERHTDLLMPRTADRPIAAGRMGISTAWMLTAGTLLVGAAMITVAGGPWACLAAIATWAIYLAAYTPLKRISPLNTAVGAVAGALPVAIGWCAADGPARLAAGAYAPSLAVAALGTVLYLWQFPHFMAIAWLYRRQYDAAGLKMLTTVDPTGLRAAGQATAAALAMLPASLVLAVPTGGVRLFFVAALLPLAYVAATVHFAVRRDDASARRLLLVSIGTLLGLLVAIMLLGGRIG
jgi:protoheme IX farnesyltransferase